MLGPITREYRRSLGLSQEDLAALTGLSVRSIQAIEAGRVFIPRPSSLRVLADAFALEGIERERYFRLASAEIRRPADDAAPVMPERSPKLPRSLPTMLPADVPGFVGRAEELDTLDRRLVHVVARRQAPEILVISGPPGVGKTTLAVHWAHRRRDMFPDGQLYVNLRGFDPAQPPASTAEALRIFLAALNVDVRQSPPDTAARSALLRSVLDGRRMLMILDNARNAEQIRPLLAGTDDCAVLITSRSALTSLVAIENAALLDVDLFELDEARRFLAQRLAARKAAEDPVTVERLAVGCGRLPLALAIVAARAVVNPETPLAALADELARTPYPWRRLKTDDLAADVWAAISCSYEALDATTARIFRDLGRHPGPDVSLPALSSIAGLPEAEMLEFTETLTDSHLCAVSAGRFALHDVLRFYARDLAKADPGQDRTATARLADHYLHSARAAAIQLDSNRFMPAIADLPPRVVLARICDAESALTWFADEHTVLLNMVRWLHEADLHRWAWQLAYCMSPYLQRQAYWHDQVAIQRVALVAVRRDGNLLGEAHTRRLLGLALVRTGAMAVAQRHYRAALAAFQTADDPVGEGLCYLNLAFTLDRDGKHEAAIEHTRRSIALFGDAGHRAHQAAALNNLSWQYLGLGKPELTIECAERALHLNVVLNNRSSQAYGLDNIGRACRLMRRTDRAITCFQRAAALHHVTGDVYHMADSLVQLGGVHADAGDLMAARLSWRQALDVFERLGHDDAEQVRDLLARIDG